MDTATLTERINELFDKIIPLIDESLQYTVLVEEDIDRFIVTVQISGDDLKLLIGYHAKTLQSWQQLLRTMISRYAAEQGQTEAKYTLAFDIGNYRQEQDERVIRRAKEAIEQVRFLQEPVTLPPMNARHRRLVHVAVGEEEDIESTSDGEGADRRVTITLKK